MTSWVFFSNSSRLAPKAHRCSNFSTNSLDVPLDGSDQVNGLVVSPTYKWGIFFGL